MSHAISSAYNSRVYEQIALKKKEVKKGSESMVENNDQEAIIHLTK